MKNTIYVYGVDPIDDFHLWMRPSQLFYHPGNSKIHTHYEYEEMFSVAKIAAKFIGWDGTVQGLPAVSLLPPRKGKPYSQFLIAWGQDKAGMCFIASPIELPWVNIFNNRAILCTIERKHEWDLEPERKEIKITMEFLL